MVGFHPMPWQRILMLDWFVNSRVLNHGPVISQLKQLIADEFRSREIDAHKIPRHEPLTGNAAESRTTVSSIENPAGFIRMHATIFPFAKLNQRLLALARVVLTLAAVSSDALRLSAGVRL